MISFKQWCIDNNREKTLSFWDYDKNCFLPTEVSPHARKRIYLKCPECGREWMVKLPDLSNLDLEEISCTSCNVEMPEMSNLKHSKSAEDYEEKMNSSLFCDKDDTEEEITEKQMISFEKWCVENNRKKTLAFWDVEKNSMSPSEVSFRSSKTVFLKCPVCNSEWESIIHDLTDIRCSEDKCKNCKIIARKEKEEKRQAEAESIRIENQKKREQLRLQRENEKALKKAKSRKKPIPEVGETIAVIDTETTWYDKVMSVGVAIVDTNDWSILAIDYWLVEPFCDQPGMYSEELSLEGQKAFSLAYQYCKDLLDSAQTRRCSREECIADLEQLLLAFNVNSLFAYNAHFDKRHLIELTVDGFAWFDLMAILPYSIDNPFLMQKYSRNGVLKPSSDLIFTAEKGARLAQNNFVSVMKLFPECKNYHETHNGLLDAIDEALSMRFIGLSREKYQKGFVPNTAAEREKCKIYEEVLSVRNIPFSELFTMSYEEFVDYLRKKYGPVKKDYYKIYDEEEGKYECKYSGFACVEDGVYHLGRKKYPIEEVMHEPQDSTLGLFGRATLWHSKAEKLYISFGLPVIDNTRTDEGLVIHHVDEDKAPLLNNPLFACKYPISYQKRERLVYCDYLEHLLLHSKISSDGSNGGDLIAADIQLFLDGKARFEWQLPCAKRVINRPDDIALLIGNGILITDEEDNT